VSDRSSHFFWRDIVKTGKLMIIAACAGFVFAFGCSTVLWAADSEAGDQMKLRNPQRSALVDNKFYSGYGEIEILADGLLLVSVRKMVTVDDGDGPDNVELLESSGYSLDPTGLSLVEYGNEFFLDQDGIQLQRRGLTADQVGLVPFGVAGRAPSTEGNDVLDTFAGEMNMRPGGPSGSVFLSVLDAGTARLFTVTLGAGTGGARDGSGGQVQESTCSISSCKKGSSTITCYGEGCVCRCKNDRPDCHCVSNASVE